jgi:uncharacterized membrane protein YgdD (TMEM256/DUF423 family)
MRPGPAAPPRPCHPAAFAAGFALLPRLLAERFAMPAHARLFLVLGAFSAAASVALGAVGAHSQNAELAASLPLFQTAVQYHQLHALGLLVVGLIAGRFPASRWFASAGWLMVAGTFLFSGNLYLRSLAGFDALHALVPVGGGAFIFSWLALAIGLLSPAARKP